MEHAHTQGTQHRGYTHSTHVCTHTHSHAHTHAHTQGAHTCPTLDPLTGFLKRLQRFWRRLRNPVRGSSVGLSAWVESCYSGQPLLHFGKDTILEVYRIRPLPLSERVVSWWRHTDRTTRGQHSKSDGPTVGLRWYPYQLVHLPTVIRCYKLEILPGTAQTPAPQITSPMQSPMQFDSIMREALESIVSSPITDWSWQNRGGLDQPPLCYMPPPPIQQRHFDWASISLPGLEAWLSHRSVYMICFVLRNRFFPPTKLLPSIQPLVPLIGRTFMTTVLVITLQSIVWKLTRLCGVHDH